MGLTCRALADIRGLRAGKALGPLLVGKSPSEAGEGRGGASLPRRSGGRRRILRLASGDSLPRDEGQKRMAAWLDSPEGGLRSLKEAIGEDSHFEWGRKLLSLGPREEAMGEFEDRYPVQPVSPSMHPR